MLEENWPVVELFIASGTQWRRGGMSGTPTGLDYDGVRAVAGFLGVETTRDVFAGLQVMESAALKAMLRKRRG